MRVPGVPLADVAPRCARPLKKFGALDPTAFPPEYEYVVGFEDLLGGGDEDYNDAVFAVRGVGTTVTPEPLTMTLLATGLAGLSGAGLRRRRQQD